MSNEINREEGGEQNRGGEQGTWGQQGQSQGTREESRGQSGDVSMGSIREESAGEERSTARGGETPMGTASQSTEEQQPRRKQRRGFAAMDPAKQKEIASKGGKASHEQGTGHEWDSETAREAGRKGGQASRGGRGKIRSPEGGGTTGGSEGGTGGTGGF